MDYSGDGKTDMLEAEWYVYENVKRYTNWYYRKRLDNGFTDRTSLPGQINDFFDRFLKGDFNGDGLMDLLCATYIHENHELLIVNKLLISNGNGFTEKWLEDAIEAPMGNMPELVVGDFDGNGIDELLISYKDKDPNQDNTFIWQFKDEYPYCDVVFWGYIDFGNHNLEEAILLAGDFNGNGKTDLLRTAEYGVPGGVVHNSFIYEVDALMGSTFNYIYHGDFVRNGDRLFPGDFNGDGITDMLVNNGVNWRILWFNGKDDMIWVFSPPITNFDPYNTNDQYYHGIQVADFNGDGKTDIAEFELESNTHVYADYKIFYSNGKFRYDDNPVTGQIDVIAGVGLNFFGGSYHIKHYKYKFHVDFNGDGRFDLYQTQGYYDDNIYFFDKYNSYDKLLAITNGFDNRTEISYKPLTDDNIYTKSTGSEFPIVDIQLPIYVVDKVVPDGEFGSNLETTYQYSGARVHKHGKGFLGFTQTVATSKLTSTRTITDYELFNKTINDKELYFMPYPKTITQYSLFENTITVNKMLSKTVSEMDVIGTQSVSDLIYYPVTTSTLTHTWDNDDDHTFISTTKSLQLINNIDDYGNSLFSQIATDNIENNNQVSISNYQFVTSITNNFNESIDIDNWLLSRPTFTKVEQHDELNGTHNHIVKREYEYYLDENEFGFSLPRSVTIQTVPTEASSEEYYHSFDIKQYFVYDVYGNIIKKTKTAPNAEPPIDDIVTNYIYDESDQFNTGYAHRFLTKVVIPSLGDDYVKQFVYNPVTGNVEKEISPSGLITQYEYDGFGRLNKTIYSDGTFEKNDFVWIEGSTATSLFYSVQTNQNSGAPPYLVADTK